MSAKNGILPPAARADEAAPVVRRTDSAARELRVYPEDGVWLKTSRAAEVLGISERAVQQHAQSGKLENQKLQGKLNVKVPSSLVAEWERAQEASEGDPEAPGSLARNVPLAGRSAAHGKSAQWLQEIGAHFQQMLLEKDARLADKDLEINRLDRALQESQAALKREQDLRGRASLESGVESREQARPWWKFWGQRD